MWLKYYLILKLTYALRQYMSGKILCGMTRSFLRLSHKYNHFINYSPTDYEIWIIVNLDITNYIIHQNLFDEIYEFYVMISYYLGVINHVFVIYYSSYDSRPKKFSTSSKCIRPYIRFYNNY